MVQKFKNVSELVDYLIAEAPNNKGAGIGLGVSSPRTLDKYELRRCGDNHIKGYFHTTGKFYNKFIVLTSYHDADDAEKEIKRIREAIAPYYD